MGSATLSTMIYAGQTMSLGIMLYIFAIYIGNVQITLSNIPLFLQSLNTAFLVFAGIAAVGIVVSLLIDGKRRRKLVDI